MSSRLPEVSLISSWCIPLGASVPESPPAGIYHAIKQRVALLDLYFLDPVEVPWYARAAGIAAPETCDAMAFAASLDKSQIENIAAALTALMTEHYAGSLVGPRPRFAALDTYWPLISLPQNEDLRGYGASTIRAVQNSLYLATVLGAHCVEIVGGSALPEEPNRRENAQPGSYRKERLRRLAENLTSVYADNYAVELFGKSLENIPCVALEIEPGAAFLINGLEQYRELRKRLSELSSSAWGKTLLNLDVAHCRLIDEEPGTSPGRERVLDQIRKKDSDLRHLIGHMHLADHARTHASDLAPGTYHFYSGYEEWLQLAVDLTRDQATHFSGVVAIELEACNDIHDAVRAIGRVSRWLDRFDDSTKPQELDSGAILVVDIGNSTSILVDRPGGAENIRMAIERMCSAVHQQRGAILSFTGDGVIAFFHERHFRYGSKEAAARALEAADRLWQALSEVKGVTLRCALHYGAVLIPTSGGLRHQGIGKDVVCAARLCDWIAKTIEAAVPESDRNEEQVRIKAISDMFHRELEPAKQAKFGSWGKVTFKGLKDPVVVYIEKQMILPRPGNPA